MHISFRNSLRIYQNKQNELRTLLKRNKKRSQQSINDDIVKKDLRISELEHQIEILTASHVAMIRVVGELGGMSKWMKFFESYKEVRDSLNKLNALPEVGDSD